jgi:hypothetical protein
LSKSETDLIDPSTEVTISCDPIIVEKEGAVKALWVAGPDEQLAPNVKYAPLRALFAALYLGLSQLS